MEVGGLGWGNWDQEPGVRGPGSGGPGSGGPESRDRGRGNGVRGTEVRETVVRGTVVLWTGVRGTGVLATGVLGTRVWGTEVRGPGSGDRGPGIGVWGPVSGDRGPGTGFRGLGSGDRGWGTRVGRPGSGDHGRVRGPGSGDKGRELGSGDFGGDGGAGVLYREYPWEPSTWRIRIINNQPLGAYDVTPTGVGDRWLATRQAISYAPFSRQDATGTARPRVAAASVCPATWTTVSSGTTVTMAKAAATLGPRTWIR